LACRTNMQKSGRPGPACIRTGQSFFFLPPPSSPPFFRSANQGIRASGLCRARPHNPRLFFLSSPPPLLLLLFLLKGGCPIGRLQPEAKSCSWPLPLLFPSLFFKLEASCSSSLPRIVNPPFLSFRGQRTARVHLPCPPPPSLFFSFPR